MHEGKNKHDQGFSDNFPVIITDKSNFEHGKVCTPSAKQQQMTRSRSGARVGSLSDMILFTLCNMAKNNVCKLKHSSIKSVIRSFWSANENITKHDILTLE